MAIFGVDFENQLVRSRDLAVIMWEAYGKKNGVIQGLDMSHTSSAITIQEGLFLICGREGGVEGSEVVEIPIVTSGTAYCRLVIEVDLSKTNTEQACNQVVAKIVSSYTAYPTLTQQNLIDHPDDGVYQMPLARFICTNSGIDNWVDERPAFTSTAIVPFPANGWSASAPYTQTVSSNDIVGARVPDFGLYIPDNTSASDGAAMQEAFSYVGSCKTEQGSVTLKCYGDKPTQSFQIQIKE